MNPQGFHPLQESSSLTLLDAISPHPKVPKALTKFLRSHTTNTCLDDKTVYMCANWTHHKCYSRKEHLHRQEPTTMIHPLRTHCAPAQEKILYEQNDLTWSDP